MAEEPVSAPLISLFELDLGGNGGTFCPESLEEAQEWVERERNFWQGIHGGRLPSDHPAQELLEVWDSQMTTAKQLRQQGKPIQGPAGELKSILIRTFFHRQLPHSSSPVGIKVAAFRENRGPEAAASLLGLCSLHLGQILLRLLRLVHGTDSLKGLPRDLGGLILAPGPNRAPRWPSRISDPRQKAWSARKRQPSIPTKGTMKA